MKSNQYDLTQGGILNKLLLVALPIMGVQFMQMTYNLTDMFWLGRVGSEAVAASGTVGMYMWLSMAFLMLGRMGAEIGVSQNIGRGDLEAARSYAQNALTLGTVLGTAFALVMIVFREPLIGFFQIREASVVADAQLYLWIVSIGIPMTFISAVTTGCFNASGNSRVPFYINAVGLILNMILDPVMIFGFGWGIAGAALATVIGQAVVCVICVIALKYARQRPFTRFHLLAKPSMERLRQIFKWSTPVALESLLFTFLTMLVSRMVVEWGTEAIAVQRVGSQVESLSWLISGGYSLALTSFVGQNFGAGRWTRIDKGYKLSTAAMLVWGVAVTAILFFGARLLFTIFLPDPQIVDAGVQYLRILALCQLAMCMENVAGGCFRGMGKTLPPSLVSIISNAARVPAAYFLSRTPLGLNGIWLGVCLGAIVRGAWLYLWYLWQRRKQPKVDDEPVGEPA